MEQVTELSLKNLIFEGADVCINLAGRSVDCRYNAKNRAAMYDSRILSTRVLNQAIASLQNPPRHPHTVPASGLRIPSPHLAPGRQRPRPTLEREILTAHKPSTTLHQKKGPEDIFLGVLLPYTSILIGSMSFRSRNNEVNSSTAS